jgi:hypothetical protein
MSILKAGVVYLIIIFTVGITTAVIFYWNELLTYHKIIYCFYLTSIIANIVGRIVIKIQDRQINKMIKKMHKNNKGE